MSLRNQNSGGSIQQGSSVKKMKTGGRQYSSHSFIHQMGGTCLPPRIMRNGRCVMPEDEYGGGQSGGRARSTMNRGGTTLVSPIVQTGKGRGRRTGMGRKSVMSRNRTPRPAMRRR
jgi:hypothetical protein